MLMLIWPPPLLDVELISFTPCTEAQSASSLELTSCSTTLAPVFGQAKLILNDAVRADGLS